MTTVPEKLDAPSTATLIPARTSGPTGRVGLWRAILLAIPLAVAVLVFAFYAKGLVGIDYTVYRGAAATLLDRKPLYEFLSEYGYPFTYPPAAAVLFIPLAVLPAAFAMSAWTFLSILAMEIVVWLALRHLNVADQATRLRWTAGFTVLGLSFSAVVFNTWIGQINNLLMLLIFLDLLTATGRFRGVLIGIAAGIKLTPLIFIPYLLFTRRYRAAATATATFAGTVLLGFAVTPKDAADYWRQYVFDVGNYVDRITAGGQIPFLDSSLSRLLSRLHLPNLGVLYLALAVVVGLLGLAVAIRASRSGYELAGVVACGITALLVSPVSWTFHWVWLVPLMVMFTVHAWRNNWPGEKVGVVLLWLAYLGSAWWVVRQIREDPNPAPVDHFYATLQDVVAVAALVGIVVHLRRRAATTADAPEALP